MRTISLFLIFSICFSCVETEIRTREIGRTLERKTYDYDPEPQEIEITFEVEGDKLWGKLSIKEREEYKVETVKERVFTRDKDGDIWQHPGQDVFVAIMTFGISAIIQLTNLSIQLLTVGEIERR